MSGSPRVEVTLPAGWSRQTPAGILFGAVGPKTGTGAPSYVITAAEGQDAARLAASQLEELKRAFSKFKVTSEQPRTLGAHKGLLREQAVEMNGVPAIQLQYFVGVGSVTFVLAYTCSPSAIASGRTEAEQLFGNTRLG